MRRSIFSRAVRPGQRSSGKVDGGRVVGDRGVSASSDASRSSHVEPGRSVIIRGRIGLRARLGVEYGSSSRRSPPADGIDPFGPLDQGNAARDCVLDPELDRLVGLGDPVKVEMVDRARRAPRRLWTSVKVGLGTSSSGCV